MFKHLPAIITIITTLAVEAGNVFAFHGTAQKVDTFIITALGAITTYITGLGSDNGGTTSTVTTPK